MLICLYSCTPVLPVDVSRPFRQCHRVRGENLVSGDKTTLQEKETCCHGDSDKGISLCVGSPWQVAAVREGMSSIVPLPLLSLYTAKMVETAVCGYERVDIHMLKKVVRCVCV